MPKPTLVVMAAGIGSRYGGLKQLDPVGPHGELILDYSVYDALRAGFGRVVFIIKQDIERPFREKVSKAIEKHCETAYVFQRLDDLPPGLAAPPERQKPWGTGHAVLTAREAVHSPFAVINADDFYGRSSYRILHDYLQNAQDRDGVYDYCMVGYLLKNTLTEHGAVARGICAVDGAGFLTDVRERTKIERVGGVVQYADGERAVELAEDSIASLNLWGFTPSIFSALWARMPRFLQENSGNLVKAEYFLPDVVGEMIKERKAQVRVLSTDERWFGLTYKEDKPGLEAAIREMIRQGVYPENLWGGGT